MQFLSYDKSSGDVAKCRRTLYFLQHNNLICWKTGLNAGLAAILQNKLGVFVAYDIFFHSENIKLTHVISSTTGETRSPNDWMTGTHVEYCVVLICDTATVCPDSWLDTICLNCTVVLNTDWAGVEARFCDIALVCTAFVFISWLAAELAVCGRFNGDAPLSPEREFWTLSFPLASSRMVWKQKPIIVRDHGNISENVKKAIGLMSKTTLHVQHAFLYISSSSLHDYDVQMPNYSFYRGHEEVATKLYFAFWNWIWFLGIQHWESSPTFDKVSEFLYSRWRLQKREFTFYAMFLPLSSSTNLKVAFYHQREHKTNEISLAPFKLGFIFFLKIQLQESSPTLDKVSTLG